MARQVLTDGSGRYFYTESAEKFEEATFWDGNNHVSKATGARFHHEALHLTAGGWWVLHRWSQWQGSAEEWLLMEPQEAARWLSINERAFDTRVPEGIKGFIDGLDLDSDDAMLRKEEEASRALVRKLTAEDPYRETKLVAADALLGEGE